MTPLPANPWIIVHETRFTLDEQRFFSEIKRPPVNPPPEGMSAIELLPIVELLTAY